MIECELFRRRVLPHWDVPGAVYFVTSCLEGSIPAKGLLDIDDYQRELEARPRPDNMTEEDWDRHCWKLLFSRTDRWLDQEPAVECLKRPELATEVMKSLLHFGDERYEVLAFVVMSSHFHWAFRPLQSWVETIPVSREEKSPRQLIMKSIKSYSSRMCNQLLMRTGQFWQEESFDHWVRDADELERIIAYIENNPVRAGLVTSPSDWPCSSAYLRACGIPFRRMAA